MIIGIICWQYYKNTDKYKPKTVPERPSGFIELNEAIDENTDIIQYNIFETNISFSDIDYHEIGTWDIQDSELIVLYSGEYYVKEKSFNDILETAKTYYETTGQYLSKIVFEKPSGFIELNKALEGNEEFLNCMFFENALFFMTADDSHQIDTWNVRDSELIVLYSGEYYVNEKAFNEILETAKINAKN